MAKFSTSLNQLKEFAKIAKEPIDAQSLNKSIASMVSSLAVLQELASTANSGNISKLKKEYNALFEIVQKIQEFQKNGGSTKDAKLTGSATSMSKAIDKLEDKMMAYYGKTKKEAEAYLLKQRQLVELMKDESLSAKERYDISRKINRLNIEALDTVKSIQASENKHTAEREKDYLNQFKLLSVVKEEAVIEEKITSSKLKQLQIDREKVKNLTLSKQRIGSNKNVAVRVGYPDNKVFVDEMKIKEKNIKLNNKLLAFETKMQGFAGGKIKSVQKELTNIRLLEKEYKDIGNQLLTQKLTTQQINKLSLQRVDIEGKIANQQRLTSNIANKGTLWSNTKSNLSIGKLASRVSFVSTAKLSYTAMQFVSDAFREVINLNVKLQDELSKTFAIMVDKSEEAKSKMRIGVMSIMAKYNMTLEESTEGLYNVISAQIEESKALNVLAISASTAKANFSDLGNTTKLITGILNAYNMGADDASRVSDVLSESVRLGVVTLDEYANSLGTIVPSANAAGVSYEELTAVITTMTKKGIHADKAITSLRQVFQMLTTPTQKQKDLLADYGIDLNVLDLRANGLIKTMEQLGGVLLEDQFGVATSRRGREALLSFLGDIDSNYQNLDAIMNANGATQRMLAERTSTLSSNWDTLTKTLSNFIATRSGVEGFFGSLNSLIGSYNEAINLANIQTEEMIQSDVINVKFSKNLVVAKQLTSEINELTKSTDALADPTSKLGKKLKLLNDMYFDAGMNVDFLKTSQNELNKTLEESIGVYERLSARKLAIDKRAETVTAIWEVKAKKEARSREIARPTSDKAKLINLPGSIKGLPISKDGANQESYKENIVNPLFNKYFDGAKFGQWTTEQTKWATNTANKAIKELAIEVTDEEREVWRKYFEILKKEKTRAIDDKQLKALDMQENQLQENFIIWDGIVKKQTNDTLKTIDKMTEEEAKRLKDLEEKKTLLDESITKFKENAFNFGDSSDKVQTRSNISQKITDAKKLRGEIEELRKLDDTYDKNESLTKWVNAQINKLEVELNSIIRDFSDFPITVDAKINNILNETVDTVNNSMSDDEINNLAKTTINKLSTYLESIGEEPVNAEITKWLDDLLKSMRSAFKNYRPEKIDASLDDLEIPLQIDIAKVIKNGLETVTNSMSQSEYMLIVDNMIDGIIASMINYGANIDPVLIAKLRDELIKSVTGSAIGYKGDTTSLAKTPKSLGSTFLSGIGFNTDTYAMGKKISAGDASEEEILAQTEAFNQMVVDTTINSTKEMYDILEQMQIQSIENQLQRKLDALDAEEDAQINAVNSEILTEEHRNREINAITNKYNKKREKEEEKASKKQAKINKRMAMIDATMRFANASMGIWSFWSDKQPVMIPIMQALLAGVYGANMKLISDTKFRDGGMLEGASHENGGIPLLGRSGNYYGEAEGGEIIFSKRASDKNTELLLSMNKHLSSGGDISTFLSSYLNGRSSGGNKNVGSMYRDGGMTRRFSTNGATIDSSMFERFAFIDLQGVDERQIYRMSRMGKLKDRGI